MRVKLSCRVHLVLAVHMLSVLLLLPTVVLLLFLGSWESMYPELFAEERSRHVAAFM